MANYHRVWYLPFWPVRPEKWRKRIMNTAPQVDFTIRRLYWDHLKVAQNIALLEVEKLIAYARLYDVPETLEDLMEARALIRFASTAIREQLA